MPFGIGRGGRSGGGSDDSSDSGDDEPNGPGGGVDLGGVSGGSDDSDSGGGGGGSPGGSTPPPSDIGGPSGGSDDSGSSSSGGGGGDTTDPNQGSTPEGSGSGGSDSSDTDSTRTRTVTAPDFEGDPVQGVEQDGGSGGERVTDAARDLEADAIDSFPNLNEEDVRVTSTDTADGTRLEAELTQAGEASLEDSVTANFGSVTRSRENPTGADDDPAVIDEDTLPTTDDGTPVVHSYPTESRSGAALDTEDEFILLFSDRAVHATVTDINTEDGE